MNRYITRLETKSTKQNFFPNETDFFKVNYYGGTTSSDGSQCTFTNNKGLYFQINFDAFHKYASIKSIKIRLKATTTGTGRSIDLRVVNSMYGDLGYSAGIYPCKSDGTFEIEVLDRCYSTHAGTQMLACLFTTETTIYTHNCSTTYFRPYLVVEYVDDKESIINQKMIDGSAGRALDYSINVRTGRPTFTKSLFSNITTVVPINLGIYFEPLKATETDGNMPQGWRFNYNQIIISNDEGYEYIDGSGIRHQFAESLNDFNVCYDISGNGLVLTVKDDSFEIDDGYKNLLIFDSSGKLIRIIKKIGSNSFGLEFEYVSGTKNIKTIKEYTNGSTVDKVSITYNTSGFTITATGFPSVTATYDSLSRLSTITEEDSRVSTYEYDENKNLLASAMTDNGEKALFTYDSRYRVKTVTDCVTNETNTLSKLTFTYGHLSTKTKNYFNVETGYCFNDEGELIGEFEIKDNEYQFMKMINKADGYLSMDIANAEAYFGYGDKTLNGNSAVSLETLSKSSNYSKGDLTLNTTDDFSLSFVYKFVGAVLPGEGEANGSFVSVVQDDEELCREYLSQLAFADSIGNVNFKCNSSSTDIKVVVAHNINKGQMILKNIRISPSNIVDNQTCVDTYLGNASTYSIDGAILYNFSKMKFAYGSSSAVVQKYMYYEDIIETQKNIKLNSSSYHAWYNKKRGLVANTSNVRVNSDIGLVQINSFSMATKTKNKNVFSVNLINFNAVNCLKTEYTKMKNDINLLTLEEKKTNTDFQVVYSKDSNGIIKESTFDQYGNVTMEKTSNVSDSKYITKYCSYDKMLLISETSYVGENAAVTNYSRNTTTGDITKITFPDGLEVNYEYFDSTNAKPKRIYSNIGGTTNSNNLIYTYDKVSNYKAYGYGHGMTYDRFNMIYRHNIGSNYISTINRNINVDGLTEETYFGYDSYSFNVKNTTDKYGNSVLQEESISGVSNPTLEAYYSDLATDSITTTDPTNDSSLKKNGKSKLRKVYDGVTSNTTKIYYNNVGKEWKKTNSLTTYSPSSVELTYDDSDRVYKNTVTLSSGSLTNTLYYLNDFTEEVSKIIAKSVYGSYTYTGQVNYDKDTLGRIIQENMTLDNNRVLKRIYTYLDNGNNCCELVKSISIYVGTTANYSCVDVINYSYDLMGRIIKVNNNENTILINYTYDKLGRLIREDNKGYNQTTEISYDLNGNILEKRIGSYTTGILTNFTRKSYGIDGTYTDFIYSYAGETINTSSTGNITSFGSTTYSWTRQHYLSRVYKSSYNYVNYSYAGNGTRIKKYYYNNGTGVTHTYVTDGKKILRETISGGSYAGTINYLYVGDEVIGLMYNNSKYIFKKNLQNDIIGIYDSSNNLVARYEYDAWGNHKVYDQNGNLNTTSYFIGNVNPFRYRSYYYDRETNLYYCYARYYNPDLCRWMSLDSLKYLDHETLNGMNLYAYCNNDPVNYSDPKGHFPWIGMAIGMAIGFLTSYIPDVVNNMKDGIELSDLDTFTKENMIKYAGAAVGGAVGALGNGIATSALANGVGNVIEAACAGDITSGDDVMVQFVLGAVIGGVSEAAVTGITNARASKKIYGILGDLSDNYKVNRRLANEGFDYLKIGRDGLSNVYNKMYKELGYKKMEKTISYALDCITGLVF